jgi:hypothetical protein
MFFNFEAGNRIVCLDGIEYRQQSRNPFDAGLSVSMYIVSILVYVNLSYFLSLGGMEEGVN